MEDSWEGLPFGRTSGDAYFDAAKKRLGILDGGLMCAQGHFMAGIYEMSRMRVLEACYHYHQAGANLQILLWHGTQRSCSCMEIESQQHRTLLERLYFSCVKTER